MGVTYEAESLQDSDHAETTVLSELFESLESADDLPTFADGPSASSFIARPKMEIEELIPEGPYTLRVLGHVYDEVYGDLLLELLKRGLLAGAQVWRAPSWIPFAEHPDFGAIQAQMTEELERVVERKRPRELTPQPHWRSPEIVRKTDEVTQPNTHRDDIFGIQTSEGLETSTSETCDDSRQTAEFDSEPFREFAAQLAAPTQRLTEDEATLEPDGDPRENPFPTVAPTDISQPLFLTEMADEEVIETREASSPFLQTEAPTRERDIGLRVRRPSPLECTQSPATQFPTAISSGTSPSPSTEPVPESAILKPSRKKKPTASIPRPLIEPAPTPQPEARSKRVPGWLVFIAAIAIVLAVITLAILGAKLWMDRADVPPQTPPAPAVQATTAASMRVAEAVPQAISGGRDLAAVAASLTDARGPHKAYVLESMHAARPSGESALQTAQVNLEIGEWTTARNFAVEAVLRGAPENDARQIFEAAILRDESMSLPGSTSLSPDAVSSAKLGADSILLQLEGEGRATFFPSLQVEHGAFRPALAMQVLCDLVACPFEVVSTRRVLLSRELLEHNLVEEPRDGDLRLSDLRWATSDAGEVVEGSLVVASPDTKRFAIEDDDMWRPWIALGDLDAEPPHGMGVRPQLSALLTIDFLVNNWGRIPDGTRETTGLRRNKLVSMRHDAAFATRSSKRVAGRFAWVEVFDRGMIARIKLLTPDAVDPLLFDANDPVSLARRDEFWKQREELLEAVEDAEKQHGSLIWL